MLDVISYIPAKRRLSVTRYCRAFESLFHHREVGPVIRLREELLEPQGGLLFDGYHSDAPASWRVDFKRLRSSTQTNLRTQLPN